MERSALALAIQTLTRLPVAATWSPEAFRRSTRYLPLVGLGIGGVAALVLHVAALGLPPLPAAALSLAATLLLTGALHEDGLADTADGLFGGRTRADALRIMHDSRVGAFGVLALLVVVAAKLGASAPVALLAAHAASRFWVAVIPAALPYARPEGLAAGLARPVPQDLAIAAIFGLPPLLLLGSRAAPALVLSAVAALAVAAYAKRRLGGYTGDVLGATQVSSEVAVLLVAAWSARPGA